jgi:hypothetical protein
MPSQRNGGQGQRKERQDGGADWQPAQQIREGAEQAGTKLREGFDTAREGMASGYRRAEGTIARYPGQSVLISFGIGFGLGIVLCQLIGQEEDSWTERNIRKPIRSLHIPETMRNVPDQAHHLAEAIAGHLPHAIRKHFG